MSLNHALGLTLAVLFASGCLPRTGPDPEHPQRWQYMCIDGWAGVTHSANQLGKDGWEMAAAAGTSDHMMWCFKRPLAAR